MSRISTLIDHYKQIISIPWRNDLADEQRVMFCVYPSLDERSLRLKVGDFKNQTEQSNHKWLLYDITDSFPKWFSQQRYATRYFQEPTLMGPLISQYPLYIKSELENLMTQSQCDNNTVVALLGVGSIFGFAKVKTVVDTLSPIIPGRLLVFFPGSYQNNNYRLMDAYDGWNYKAIPITIEETQNA